MCVCYVCRTSTPNAKRAFALMLTEANGKVNRTLVIRPDSYDVFPGKLNLAEYNSRRRRPAVPVTEQKHSPEEPEQPDNAVAAGVLQSEADQPDSPAAAQGYQQPEDAPAVESESVLDHSDADDDVTASDDVTPLLDSDVSALTSVWSIDDVTDDDVTAVSDAPPALSVDHTYAWCWPLSDDVTGDDVIDDDMMWDISGLTSIWSDDDVTVDDVSDDSYVTGAALVQLDHNYCCLYHDIAAV